MVPFTKSQVCLDLNNLKICYNGITCIEIDADENDGDGEEGTYFVDQAGHYYYQAKGESQPVMTISGINDADGAEGEEFIINPENDEDGAEEDAEEVSG